MRYDLHSHSTASDGALSPTQLLQRAADQGVDVLALTDHDTVEGLDEAQTAADAVGISLIPGIELSCSWENKTVHIVGLNVDPNFQGLQQGSLKLREIREQRAHTIAHKLEKKRIPGALTAVQAMAGTGMITRSHFADFLVSEGHVAKKQQAFDYYLGHGKPAFVKTEWASLEQALAWIHDSGGIAVIAHPARYKLSRTWMKRLLGAFKELGGQGLEVVAGHSNPDEIRHSANNARKFGLLGSIGSDFHSPDNPWIELGRLHTLPDGVEPVWSLFSVK